MVDREYLTTGQAARALKLHPDTIRKRCEAGKVPGACQLYEGSPWRIPREWVERLKARIGVVARRAKGG